MSFTINEYNIIITSKFECHSIVVCFCFYNFFSDDGINLNIICYL